MKDVAKAIDGIFSLDFVEADFVHDKIIVDEARTIFSVDEIGIWLVENVIKKDEAVDNVETVLVVEGMDALGVYGANGNFLIDGEKLVDDLSVSGAEDGFLKV
ncbi:hypothetical protein NDU88_001556 [Pleurodeles waltl]|uniref:Uncharacterized protein n=1 Tax=Pleurodeles waltl TaxID=8319 RepID=A0AAV7ML90_PLEWA|nr:hypothetical protein NDU88_001556 [Pleurodeles waltl]